MTWDAVMNIFQGVTTLADSFAHNPKMAVARIVLIGLGLFRNSGLEMRSEFCLI